ncbi:pectinesterase QRT1-like [Andrographis paniculata]|uniref:pectinesterase QRT1-like n=1 Tax=Andrographis paniculata TaxID=175694 RepID=UPI0021E95E33|nr:pectinesterase QRT1-like [Andrographis paniculata]
MKQCRSCFWACFMVVLLLICRGRRGGAQSSDGDGINYYITWNDLKIQNDSRMSISDAEKNQNSNQNQTQKIIVVDWTGAGDSATVQGAVDLVAENNTERVKIHILPGLYREKVVVPKSKPYISFIGDENRSPETVISWHDKASDSDGHGGALGTVMSASVTVLSDYFCAMGVTFENTVVEPGDGENGYQAVALRISGEKAMFYKARFLGSQDTLNDETGSHYFYQCFIQGSVDFIFGNARSLYQECSISVVKDGYAIAAHHRNSPSEATGFSFVNCTITGTGYGYGYGDGAVFLGRAWGNYSTTVYSYSEFDLHVRPGGWDDWKVPSRHSLVTFGEHECKGVGADRSRRVPWSQNLNLSQALPYLNTTYIQGHLWLRL